MHAQPMAGHLKLLEEIMDTELLKLNQSLTEKGMKAVGDK